MLDGLKVKHLLLLPIIGVLQIYALFRYVNKADSIRQLREEFVSKNFKNAKSWNEDFYIHSNFRMGLFFMEGGIQEDDTTLVSQCSTDNLHHIEDLVRRWKGPISIAVFSPGKDAVTALYGIDVLRKCVPIIKRFVTFHIMYPKNRKPAFDEANALLLNEDCAKAMTGLTADGRNYIRDDAIRYPQNSLRNLARTFIKTKLFYLVDIDTIPSADLRYIFSKFAKKRGIFDNPDLLEAFITPAFEIQEHVRHPEVKEEVIKLIENNDMRTFHEKTCPHCHKPTQYSHWYSYQIGQEISVAYEIDYISSFEPFYLSHRDATPLYDEAFKAYGYDRISQVCEMYVKGFKFYVLDNAFVMHKGFKSKDKFHQSKAQENAHNEKIFKGVFKQSLKRKYPQSQRECIEIGSKGRAVIGGGASDHLRKLGLAKENAGKGDEL